MEEMWKVLQHVKAEHKDQCDELDEYRIEKEEVWRDSLHAHKENSHLAGKDSQAEKLLTSERESSRSELVSAREEAMKLQTEHHKLRDAHSVACDERHRLELKSHSHDQAMREAYTRLADQEQEAAPQLAASERGAERKLQALEAKSATDMARAEASTTASIPLKVVTGIDFSDPVEFSKSDKDFRIGVKCHTDEVRLDLREWYRGVRSEKVRNTGNHEICCRQPLL